MRSVNHLSTECLSVKFIARSSKLSAVTKKRKVREAVAALTFL
jgi:hypothetical protein